MLWLIGEGRFKEMVKEQLQSSHEVWESSSLTENEERPVAIISAFDTRSLSQEMEIQEWARREKVPYLRAHLYTNRAFIGPWIFPEQTGCIQCAEWRMSLVHPNREIWSTLVEAQKKYSLLNIHNGWSLPFLSSLTGIIHEEIEFFLSSQPLRLKGSVYVAYDHEWRGKVHHFIPNPNCSLCHLLPEDSPERAVIKLQPRYKPEPSLYRLPNPFIQNETLREKFYDWRMGVFHHLYRDVYSKFLPIYGAEMPLPDRKNTEIGFGRTHTYRDSELTAMLEGLERYAGMMPRGKRTVHRGSYLQFQQEAIYPPDWGIHESEQQTEPGYTYLPYDNHLEMNWVWGYSWKQQKPVLIPEQMVYYRLPETKEKPTNRFVYETSNGCAMGGSIEEAIFYALMEVIERDAFLVAWYNRLPLTHINLEGVEDTNILLVKDRVEAMGYQLHLFDMTMESGIPSVWALMINPDQDAKVKTYSAAGAHPNPEKAIMGAMVEVVTSVPIYEEMMPKERERAAAMVLDGSLVQEMHDHVLLYSHPDTLERFQFLFTEASVCRSVKELYRSWYEGTPSIDLTEELQALMDKILQYHDDLVIIDETTPELDEVGIKAVKVIVKGMMTMSFGHQYRRMVRKRIKEAPLIMGMRQQPIADHEINLHPHPFP